MKILILLLTLVSGGCAHGRSESLMQVVDIPPTPDIEWHQGPCTKSTSMCIDDNHFIELTKYVIKLQNAMESCNEQIKIFAE